MLYHFKVKNGMEEAWMPVRNIMDSPEVDELFQTIRMLDNAEECRNFFEDLCTVKELRDMAQRLHAAKMLLAGATYEQIQQQVEISTATISRVNRCIQYGAGGYETMLGRLAEKPKEN